MDLATTPISTCSSHSLRPRRPAWASACRSDAPSSKPMAAGCGPRPTRPAARPSALPCPGRLQRIRLMPQNVKVQNVKVYVIDDDPAMRYSLDFLLGTAGFNVRLFESAQIFLNELPALDAGCVVTDIRMPGIDGMELLRQLNPASGARKLPVIVMTGHGDVPLAVEAMKLGALDFLEKPFEDDRLIGMIETALSQSDSGAKSEALAADMAARVASLTQRERQVMQGLVTGQSNKAIAREYDISPRTVEVYRANVMTKMQAGNLSELVRFAIRAGIVED